jgi:PAS domain S-box-containing protein
MVGEPRTTRPIREVHTVPKEPGSDYLASSPIAATARPDERRRPLMLILVLANALALGALLAGLSLRQGGTAPMSVAPLAWAEGTAAGSAGPVACGLLVVLEGVLVGALASRGRRERRRLSALYAVNDTLESSVVERSRALAASEARLRAYFEHAPLGITVLKRLEDGHIVHEDTNRACAEMLDLPRERIVGQTLERVWTHGQAAMAAERVQTCLGSGRTEQMTLLRPHPGGERTLDIVVAPLPGTSTPGQAAILYMLDVTEAHALGARVLAQAGAQAELAATAHPAEKMAAIGRIAAGVAHDFNNILQAVIGGLALILDDAEPGSEIHEFAALAKGSAERGASLTHHLLAYAGQEILWPQPVDPAAFLRELRDMLARVLRAGITVELDLDPATPAVLVDPGRLRTALLNLAVNADEAMPSGGRLGIELHPDLAASPPRVVIAVTDTGVGMDPVTAAAAIEPFFSTKGHASCGLGLSMAHGFAAQSGGELRIASRPGTGTRIELCLPPAPATEPEAEPPARQAGAAGRILLVDDTADVLVTTRAFLARAGFDVLQAESGDAALALLAAGERIDALVCDYAMPGLNGADLILEARQMLPGLPAVLITGYAGIAAGSPGEAAVPVLHKPIKRTQLLDTLRGVIAAAGQLSAPEARPCFAAATSGLPRA